MSQNLPVAEPAAPAASELDTEVALLYAQCAAELLTYALSFVRAHDAASDAVQETFFRYFIERSYGRVIEHPRAWLYKVLRNYALDRLDKAAVKREVAQENAADVPDRSYGPEEKFRQSQMATQMLALLSPREVECLKLRADGLSYAQMGEVLGIRPGTVSSLLTRVHNKLRAESRGSREYRAGTLEALCFLMTGGD